MKSLTTFVEHSPLTGSNCESKYMAYIRLSILLNFTYIEGFYVYPQMSECNLTLEQRNSFNKLGELIFTLAFRHAKDYHSKNGVDLDNLQVRANVC